MEVNTVFLNRQLFKEVHISPPEGFEVKGEEHMVCILKNLIYGLKEVFRQWF